MNYRCSTVLFVISSVVWSAESSLPQWSGMVSTGVAGTQFVLLWKTSEGNTFKGWLRLGDSAGDFGLADFDSKAEVLSVRDRAGQTHRLFLPEAKVRSAELSDAEFHQLVSFMMIEGVDPTTAPMLSREKAREFFLRLSNRAKGLEGLELKFDVDGCGLSPAQRATWVEEQARIRAAGVLWLASIFDGKTQLHEFPLRPYRAPEPMTRNFLDATATLKRQMSQSGKRD